MPRRVNKKCVACAQLSAEEARQVHGKYGDDCWVERRCPRKRSHYRNRRQINENRRLHYQQQVADKSSAEAPVEEVALPVGEASSAEAPVEEVALPVDGKPLPYANLYIWREKRKDAPLHAIAASVFKESSKVLEVVPIHCAGYRKRQLEKYVQVDVMGYLKARFGITFFTEEIRLEPIECQIPGCPYHDRFVVSQDQPLAPVKIDDS